MITTEFENKSLEFGLERWGCLGRETEGKSERQMTTKKENASVIQGVCTCACVRVCKPGEKKVTRNMLQTNGHFGERSDRIK